MVFCWHVSVYPSLSYHCALPWSLRALGYREWPRHWARGRTCKSWRYVDQSLLRNWFWSRQILSIPACWARWQDSRVRQFSSSSSSSQGLFRQGLWSFQSCSPGGMRSWCRTYPLATGMVPSRWSIGREPRFSCLRRLCWTTGSCAFWEPIQSMISALSGAVRQRSCNWGTRRRTWCSASDFWWWAPWCSLRASCCSVLLPSCESQTFAWRRVVRRSSSLFFLCLLCNGRRCKVRLTHLLHQACLCIQMDLHCY